MKPGCGATCKRKAKCSDIFTDEERKSFNKEYHKRDFSGKKAFLLDKVHRFDVKRRPINDPGTSRKKQSYQYHFKKSNGTTHTVCKSFFLGTLGNHPKSDQIISNLFKKLDDDTPNGSPTVIDNRGKHTKRVSDKESIRQHIESYGPAVSHYNREKTPLRRYLPGDISIKAMFDDYNLKYPEKKCSYSCFYQV